LQYKFPLCTVNAHTYLCQHVATWHWLLANARVCIARRRKART